VLPATHRPQGFVDAHNPHTPARALSAWQIILDGADQAERPALRSPSTRTVPNALAPALADVAAALMHLFRMACDFRAPGVALARGASTACR
jgi:hypothetical protein